MAERVVQADAVIAAALQRVGLDGAAKVSDALQASVVLELRRVVRGLEMLLHDQIPYDDID